MDAAERKAVDAATWKSFAQRLQVYARRSSTGGEDSPRHGAGGSFWRGRRSGRSGTSVCVVRQSEDSNGYCSCGCARRMCRIVHGLMKWERGSTRRWMADMKEGAMHGRSRKRDALTVSASTPRADSCSTQNAPPARQTCRRNVTSLLDKLAPASQRRASI